MVKKSSNGKEKVIIGVTGVLLGALGITVWNNREKIKDTATSAKERAIVLKTKTTEIADTVKSKLMLLKNSQDQNIKWNVKNSNTSEEVPFTSLENSLNAPYIDSSDDTKQEQMDNYFDTLHNFLDDLQKRIDEKKE